MGGRGSCCKEPSATRECHAACRLCQDQEGLPTEQQQAFHSRLHPSLCLNTRVQLTNNQVYCEGIPFKLITISMRGLTERMVASSRYRAQFWVTGFFGHGHPLSCKDIEASRLEGAAGHRRVSN